MTSLAQHHSNDFTKLIILGDAGTGKTGSLTPLVCAGYKLRILDMDNGLETLKTYVAKECPDFLGNVEYRTLRDTYRASPEGPKIQGAPRAFVDALRMLDHWKYDDIDLGHPWEWGPDCILVVDSLTFLSDAAFAWAEPLTPKSERGSYDKRATYGIAQDAIEKVLDLLTGVKYETNVIIIAHVKYVDNPDGTRKGYPTAVGSALSPIIPRYFNSVALCEVDNAGRRSIRTTTTPMVTLKNPKPFEMAPRYDIGDGLAEFFKVLRTKETPPTPKPKQQQLPLRQRRA
jgi:hypothetical protein